MPLFLSSQGVGVGVLKAGCQLQEGSLHPKIQDLWLQTLALVFALRLFALEGAGGDNQAYDIHNPIHRQ